MSEPVYWQSNIIKYETNQKCNCCEKNKTFFSVLKNMYKTYIKNKNLN